MTLPDLIPQLDKLIECRTIEFENSTFQRTKGWLLIIWSKYP